MQVQHAQQSVEAVPAPMDIGQEHVPEFSNPQSLETHHVCPAALPVPFDSACTATHWLMPWLVWLSLPLATPHDMQRSMNRHSKAAGGRWAAASTKVAWCRSHGRQQVVSVEPQRCALLAAHRWCLHSALPAASWPPTQASCATSIRLTPSGASQRSFNVRAGTSGAYPHIYEGIARLPGRGACSWSCRELRGGLGTCGDGRAYKSLQQQLCPPRPHGR